MNAAEYEGAIANDAMNLRGDSATLTPALFLALYPLLCRPIPADYIVTHPAVKGKPYESTGIRSVQVQIDRMNNVLTPMWWWDSVEYHLDGKLCEVTISVGNLGNTYDQPPDLYAARSSWGGVNQGSTTGNIYKGSYTNAAKRAFAALGVGHEVYLGAADLDPDVNADVATVGDEPATIGKPFAKKLVDRVWEIPDARGKLQLAASHAAERDVGDCSTKAKATTSLAGLSYAAAERLDAWIVKKGPRPDDPA